MPPSWRRRSRRGWPSLGRVVAKSPCPRLRGRPATRHSRKPPSRRAVPSSWPPCAPAWSSAPPRKRPAPCGQAQAQAAASRAGRRPHRLSLPRCRSCCTGAARGAAGEQRRSLACRQERPPAERAAPLPRSRPSGVRGVATMPSVRAATFRRPSPAIHAAAGLGPQGQR